MFKIVGEPDGRLGVESLTIPGVELEYICCKCGETTTEYTSADMDYPPVGIPFDYVCKCGHCDHSWGIRLILGITLDIAVEH